MNTIDFIERAKKIHGDKYDYSKVEYVASQKKVCVICPIHGEFWIRPNDHLNGHGCKKCAIENRVKKNKCTTSLFIEKARQVHGDKYDYSKVDYSSKCALIIGNEGRGISPLIRKRSDFIISIPMKGDINSLNASVAAGILIYGVVRNRG